MEYNLKFGKGKMNLIIDNNNIIGVLTPNKIEVGLTGTDEVKRAMKNPIGSERLKNIVNPGEKIVIITSDITRPMPSKIVIPIVIAELNDIGIKDSDIVIVFALGSHRSQTEDEKKYLLGEDIYNRIKCVDSNEAEYIHLGITAYNTPVDICSVVVNADRRICLGNIEYHYFAGYSGGAKAIMPGVSTRAAIQSNHSRMVEENAKAGNIKTNPVRIDIDEIGKFVKIDFIVNVVLDSNKEIIKAVAGHYIEAHREGCKFLDDFYKIKIQEKADIVITTPGGYPKDINLYQAQKALDNAKHAVKDGGIIILVASCIEGLGEKTFENWMLNTKKSEDMIVEIKNNFQLGGHKAAAIAMILQHSKIFLVSELEYDFVKNIFMEPFNNVQDAYNQALSEKGDTAKVILMPVGGSTLPY
ncbi:nickel-dependent lactate racemase [Clostridium lacusfryxellense]|uniref:nickel-dependent lactate racemase n=1 Tax=Clostridium lacusfryxellense TaxID=205328 RepID=UPI001C0E07CD|nr:nickel-dependent lactate racemase [Clostridium lacusfryxellense]MBU3114200.1 nickel-dependent lactate racemase [Clostridium lacusfryxellense]